MSATVELDERSIERKLVAYLARVVGADVQVTQLKRYTVGFSWVTYGFEARWSDAGGAKSEALILRIGPPTGLFAPYHAFPQFAAFDVLQGSGVPVPRPFWWSDDADAFGAPFLICEKVAGEAPLPWVEAGREAFPPEVRESLAEQFIGALASLHRFEWRGNALERLGRVDEETAARVAIDFWEEQLGRRAFRAHPILEWGLAWLRDHAAPASRVSVVHGDYRTGNFLEVNGKLTAILDWELVHLGDPLEDLGWICLRTFRGRSPYMCHLIERERLYARYEELSGIPVPPERVRFWEAFGTMKLAVIHVGAARCFEDGDYDDLRLGVMGVHVPRLCLQLEAVIGGKS